MQKENIAILAGGFSAEYDISLKSAQVVFDALDRERYEPFLIIIKRETWHLKDNEQIELDKSDFSLVLGGTRINFNKVFIAVHGRPAEDGQLQGYLSMLNIPFTSCGTLSSALSYDKFRCKAFLRDRGIQMSEAWLLRSMEDLAQLSNLSYPLFIKPNREGSSYGAGRASNPAELQVLANEAFRFDDELIVEPFLQGREITCAVLRNGDVLQALPLTEIITNRQFFDYKAKYEGESNEVTPADIEEGLEKEVVEITKKIYDLMNCKGVIRADYILVDGKFNLLELNTVPGLSAESIVPQQARAKGWKLSQFFSILLDNC